MSQVRSRRFHKTRAHVRSSDPEPSPAPSAAVSTDTVVRSIFHDGVLTPRQSGSIYVANEQPLGILHNTRDWEKGAALHADARPDPSSGVAWHGAPWDWTVNGQLVEDYQYFNIWHELTSYSTTGLPDGVRVQYRNIEAWVLDAAQTTWTKVLGSGVDTSAGYQTSSGRPDGGYFRTTPDYVKEADLSGWSTSRTTANGYTYPASPGSKWRSETTAMGGGWSIDLDPMHDASGNLIDDLGILHGPFANTDSPDRIFVPTGGYVAVSAEVRLIMSDYSPVPVTAKYVATVGSDMFRAKTAALDPPSARSTSMCNPRHVVIPTDGSWRWLGHCSGSAAMIRAFPTLPFINS